jgi:DNA modification methylase
MNTSTPQSAEATKSLDYQTNYEDLKKVISRITVENQIVFDPFMGYATTGIAALALRRKFIGIEIEEEYFKTA